jgi:O-antigen/teichoic acid export membrane protein
VAELKNKVIRGFAWNVGEKVASAMFSAWVTVNIINRIVPEEYALKAIFVPLVAIFNIFVDSGFSQALIRNRHATQTDYSSAFWFNIAASVVIYALLVGIAWPAAWFLDMPDLVRFAPVFFLVVPLGALGLIQQTVLSREFDFRRMSAITFASNVGSGLVGVALASGGLGFWAIVGQRVSQISIRTALLWIFGRWRPLASFSTASIRTMLGYSSRLLGTDLLNNLYAYIPNFIIGRTNASATLGIYEQARSLRDLPVTSTMSSMQSVTFPALASIGDDDEKFAAAVGRVLSSIMFLMLPMMAGLILVADEVFGIFLVEHWWSAVPFFRILCIAGAVTPLAVVSSNILRTRSDGRDVMRAEVVKKIFATVILAATIPFGVTAIAWGVVGIAFTDAAVTFAFARRHSRYGLGALVRDVLPVVGLTLVMVAAVAAVSVVAARPVLWAGSLVSTKFALGLLAGVKVVAGAGVYMAGAAILRLAAFREFTELVRRVVGKVRGGS